MIKRQSQNKPLPSLVNSAQNEHFNVTEAIRTDAPITSVKSVAKSINFENDYDGAYIIRKPLILKENVDKNSWTLYDNKHVLTINNIDIGGLHFQKFYIKNPTNTSIPTSLRGYDKNLNYVKKNAVTTGVGLSSKILKVYNTSEQTLIVALINPYLTNVISNIDLIDSSMHYDYRNPSADNVNKSIYRLLKIYKNLESSTDEWIIEIVHPEFNSITSGLDVGNANTLDINLLLDNPYAVRDLYGYGYNSVTKILAYVPLSYSKANIDDLRVIDVTEDIPYVYNNALKGFKNLVASNPVDIYGKMIVLKACLTTAVTNTTYYCCWEQSTNGIDWETCPEFIDKFSRSSTNSIVERLVSDITSAEFEKVAYDDSLDKAATYLVTKKMVRLNVSTGTDLSQTNYVKDRPDILILENPNLNLYYRFLIYVDSGKVTPVPDAVKKTVTKSYFDNIGNEETALDTLGKFTYQTFTGNGVDSDVAEGAIPDTKAPELVNGSILLYESASSSYWGNYICIKNNESNYIIREIRIILDNKTFHAADTLHPADYYTELGTKFKYKTSPGSSEIGSDHVSGGTSQNTTMAGQITYFSINSSGTSISSAPGITTVLIGNDSASLPVDTDTKKFQYRSKIKTIEIVYEAKGAIQSTSVYLASTTGSYKVPYSKTTEYLEDISLLRKQLFENSDLYYYKEQFLFYGTNTLFVTDLGSTIIRLMNTLTFGEAVNNVISFRNYLLAFTNSSITLLKYNDETGSYDSKLLTTSIGVSKTDAKTVAVILNSIYFKSKYRVYRLIPNLYASTDDILNIHTVSGPVDKILEDLLSLNTEIGNFVYADADTYNLFIPIKNLEDTETSTYCFRYDFTRKLWTIQKYPILASSIEIPTINEAYLRTSEALYYFKEDLETLLNTTLVQDLNNVGAILDEGEDPVVVGGSYSVSTNNNTEFVAAIANSQYTSLSNIYNYIPYGDYLDYSLLDIYIEINSNNIQEIVSKAVPIDFCIDFGQKSSNYTVDKQFLESKLLFATLHVKDIFPVDLMIQTDGIQRPLHWDVNTDSALWKTSLDQIGTLNTDFEPNAQEYDGILRQLIVKYSGKGKTIRHLIKGTTKSRFKFYSMDVRSRILPVKQ